MLSIAEAGYNERLFSKGLRGFFHTARFIFLQKTLFRYGIAPKSILELGCFDGKTINYLPSVPEKYDGFDANWEGGVDIGRKKWANFPNFRFFISTSTEEIISQSYSEYDITLALETIEHLPPSDVPSYLKTLADRTKDMCIITVPNEKGPIFAIKYLAKMFLSKDYQRYSLSEYINATLCRMKYVNRDDHKGFDYAVLIYQMREHFDIIQVKGIPFPFLPPLLNFNVGIIARPKKKV